MSYYDKRLYIFGGKSQQDLYSYLADVEIFDLDFNKLSAPVLYTKSIVKLRKSHIAVVVGNHILIHGGLSEENEYLSDSCILGLSPIKWHNCNVSKLNEAAEVKDTLLLSPETSSIPCHPPVLAYHSACLVMQSEVRKHPKLNLYKYPDIAYSRKLQSRIKERGIYVFGGKTTDYIYNKDLYILKIGKKPLEWKKLNCCGKPPSQRSLCSMNYFEEGNILVIHGGRYDNLNINNTGDSMFLNMINYQQGSNEYALSDLWVLDLLKLEWIKIQVTFDDLSTKLYPRCGHKSIIYDRRLYIFGGMNSSGYLGSHVLVIELINKKRKNVNRKAQTLLLPNIAMTGLNFMK